MGTTSALATKAPGNKDRAAILRQRLNASSLQNMSCDALAAGLRDCVERVVDDNPEFIIDQPREMAKARRVIRELSRRDPARVCQLGYHASISMVALALQDAEIQLQRELQQIGQADIRDHIVTNTPTASVDYLSSLIDLHIRLSESYARFEHVIELARRRNGKCKDDSDQQASNGQSR